MKPEIEAKFLDVDFDDLRTRLREAGAVCVQPMRLLKRRNFYQMDYSLEAKGVWVRVRDEGAKLKLAYKKLDNREIEMVKKQERSAILLVSHAGLGQMLGHIISGGAPEDFLSYSNLKNGQFYDFKIED